MLFAGQPVEQFPCSKLIQYEINLLSELREQYRERITWSKAAFPIGFNCLHYRRAFEISTKLATTINLRPVAGHVFNSCAATRTALIWALNTGIGINLGGGFHHATLDPTDANNGCLVNDILLAIQNTPEIHDKRITIIDLDAHSGGGTRRTVDYLSPCGLIRVFDFFTTKGILSDSFGLVNCPIRPNHYANHFSCLQARLTGEPPEIVFLIAGGDVTDERFMDMPLTVSQAVDNSNQIVEYCWQSKIPLVITLGGGYTQDALLMWAGVINYCLTIGKTTV